MLRPYVFSPDRLPGRMASGITAERLSKTFRVKVRDPGLGGALRALLRPRYRDVHAVREVTFRIDPGESVPFLARTGPGKPPTLKIRPALPYPPSGRVGVAGFGPGGGEPRFKRAFAWVLGNGRKPAR